MAGSKQKLPRKLPVSGVYKYFKALEKAKTLKAFLADCDDKKHMLGVSNKLFVLGHKHFKASKSKAVPKAVGMAVSRAIPRRPGVEAAVGTDCPACPKPPRL